MSQPFVGEIRIFGGSFAPQGWATCDGQLLAIAQNDVLFQLIGTTFGGDGEETFALPDLRGRIPIHQGNGHVLGDRAGVETVTLTGPQLPVHTHAFAASTNLAQQSHPAGEVVAESANVQLYIEDAPSIAMSPQAILPVGGSQPHDNLQPFLVVTFIISLFGIFPSQT
jgi:microcystin-dependent protein